MNKKILSFILFLLIGISLFLIWSPMSESHSTQGEIRAAIDIGSGATNLKVAKVDPKTNKILSIIFEKSIPVPYQKHLEQSSDQTFDATVMKMGIHTIKELKDVANNYHAKKVVAVATEAFRKAKNSEAFAREIKKETGVQVQIITQDQEGILAFRGALAVTSVSADKALTWDIGGGSMQLTTLSLDGTYLVEKGKTASIPFKLGVIQQVENKEISATASPNPMTKEEMDGSLKYAATLAQQTNAFIKQKIKDPQTEILAVGSLFNYGIRPLVNHAVVQRSALELAVMKLAGKTDAELPGGSLAEVAVTNPLLVLGYMKALHIDKVTIISVNNADGALTYPPYWEATAIG